MTQGGMGCAGIGTGAGTGSAISASVLTVGVLGDGMPAGACFVVVFTLIGDGMSGGLSFYHTPRLLRNSSNRHESKQHHGQLQLCDLPVPGCPQIIQLSWNICHKCFPSLDEAVCPHQQATSSPASDAATNLRQHLQQPTNSSRLAQIGSFSSEDFSACPSGRRNRAPGARIMPDILSCKRSRAQKLAALASPRRGHGPNPGKGDAWAA